MTATPPPRLLADGMLGRLAKWLPMIGYDTAYDDRADDHELAHRSRLEGRILHTRHCELAGRKGLATVFISSRMFEEQSRQVVAQIGAPPEAPLQRCSVCNTPLEAAAAEQVTDRVRPYVLNAQQVFRICTGRGRVYWAGTHRDRILEQLKTFNQ